MNRGNKVINKAVMFCRKRESKMIILFHYPVQHMDMYKNRHKIRTDSNECVGCFACSQIVSRTTICCKSKGKNSMKIIVTSIFVTGGLFGSNVVPCVLEIIKYHHLQLAGSFLLVMMHKKNLQATNT